MKTVDEPVTSKKPDKPEQPRKRELHDAPHTQHKAEHPQRLHAPVRRVAIWGPLLAVVGLAAVLLLIFGIFRHVERAQEAEQFQKDNSETVVNVQTVHRNKNSFDLILPGSIEANQASTLYARTNGYLGKWLVDIGDNVKAGQLLAVIETPDVEQQLRQAESNLNQAKSNFEIARVTAVRWQELYEKKVVDAQDNDQQQSNYNAAAAAQSAAQANVNLLNQQLSFNQITAPFDGKITNRFLDIGALVSAGSGSAGTQIFTIEQTDPLRIYVYVPQSNAAMIHVGDTAKVLVRELPGKDFIATVTRTAGAIDATSRTLLTELQIPNKEGTLYAGMYGDVKFSLKDTGSSPLIVPANAYIFRTAGSQVVVVRDGKIHWQTFQVGRDYGTQLEAISGINEGEKVVVNPSDDLVEGMEVTAKEQPPAPVAGAAGAAPSTGGNPQSGGGSPQPGAGPKG